MESMIIEEMRAFLKLGLNPKQEKYFADTIAVAKRVEVVRAADVFNDYELKIIRDALQPQKQQCYRNAHLLCEIFPERVTYCEGKTFCGFFPIDHAFNRVGDKYVDITFEFALNNDPTGYEYVVFGDYTLEQIQRVTEETEYYGDVYRFMYIQGIKETPGNP